MLNHGIGGSKFQSKPAHLSRPLRVANSAMLDRFVCRSQQHCILAVGSPGPAEALALFDEVAPALAALAP